MRCMISSNFLLAGSRWVRKKLVAFMPLISCYYHEETPLQLVTIRQWETNWSASCNSRQYVSESSVLRGEIETNLPEKLCPALLRFCLFILNCWIMKPFIWHVPVSCMSAGFLWELMQNTEVLQALTLSLPRVINFKFLLWTHQKFNITQYGEFVFS